MKFVMRAYLAMLFILAGCDKPQEVYPVDPPPQEARLGDARGDYKIGMSESDFLALAGSPGGTVTMGNQKLYYYDGVKVTIENGKVTSLPADFERRAQAAHSKTISTTQQPRPVYQTPVSSPPSSPSISQAPVSSSRSSSYSSSGSVVPPPEEGYVLYKPNGEEVDHSYFLSRLGTTIVVFHSEVGGYRTRRSQELIGQLRGFLKDKRRVELRLVDVEYTSSDKAERYRVNNIPEVRVFNSRGEMIGRPTSSFESVVEYVNYASKL
ncbi:MAG TPA: hypothetical protein VIR63_01100 [Pontiella sp.]